MPRICPVIVLLFLTLSGCYSSYQAPVDERGRFLDAGRTHRVNGGETLYAVAWMYDLDPGALARANNLREPYSIDPGQILTVDLRNMPASATGTVAVTTPVNTGVAIQRAPISSTGITRQSLPGGTAPPQTQTPAPATTPAPPPVTATAPTPTPTPPVVATAPPEATPPVVTPPAVVPAPQPSAPVIAVPPLDPNAPVVWAWPSTGPILAGYSESGVDGKGMDFDGSKGDAVLAAADGEVVYAGGGLLRYGDLVILKHNERFLSAYAHNSAINVKEGERVARGQKIAELGSSGIDRNMLHFEIRLDGKPVDPQVYLPSR